MPFLPVRGVRACVALVEVRVSAANGEPSFSADCAARLCRLIALREAATDSLR